MNFKPIIQLNCFHQSIRFNTIGILTLIVTFLRIYEILNYLIRKQKIDIA
jgi:hypothetical protein